MEHKSIHCIVHPSYNIGFVESSTEFCSGCSVIDVTFPKVSYVEIEEIHFKNYYTAELSLLVQKRNTEKFTIGDNQEWKMCVKLKQLMPYAHCEQSSEDYFVLNSEDFRFPLQNVAELRFILFQPSPVWKEFKIEELQLYKTGSATSKGTLPLLAWISELENSKDEASEDRQLKGVTSVVELSQQMHQLWALTEQTHAAQTTSALGRYDVDGCYDINLLSYN